MNFLQFLKVSINSFLFTYIGICTFLYYFIKLIIINLVYLGLFLIGERKMVKMRRPIHISKKIKTMDSLTDSETIDLTLDD